MPGGRASRVLGDRWALLVIREALLGIDRFDQFVDRLGISRDALTSRLGWLVGSGVLARDPPEGKRATYRLTDAGRALAPVLGAIAIWGDAHLPRAVDG